MTCCMLSTFARSPSCCSRRSSSRLSFCGRRTTFQRASKHAPGTLNCSLSINFALCSLSINFSLSLSLSLPPRSPLRAQARHQHTRNTQGRKHPRARHGCRANSKGEAKQAKQAAKVSQSRQQRCAKAGKHKVSQSRQPQQPQQLQRFRGEPKQASIRPQRSRCRMPLTLTGKQQRCKQQRCGNQSMPLRLRCWFEVFV